MLRSRFLGLLLSPSPRNGRVIQLTESALIFLFESECHLRTRVTYLCKSHVRNEHVFFLARNTAYLSIYAKVFQLLSRRIRSFLGTRRGRR
jgi:hypothetical protein